MEVKIVHVLDVMRPPLYWGLEKSRGLPAIWRADGAPPLPAIAHWAAPWMRLAVWAAGTTAGLRLLGEHQCSNAASAVAAALLLRAQGWHTIDATSLLAGLADAHLPGRFQVHAAQRWGYPSTATCQHAASMASCGGAASCMLVTVAAACTPVTRTCCGGAVMSMLAHSTRSHFQMSTAPALGCS